MYWDEKFTSDYKLAGLGPVTGMPDWRNWSTKTAMIFGDQPSSEGIVDFRTRLVGVRPDLTWAFIDLPGTSFAWEYQPPPCAGDAGCVTNFEFLKNDGTLPTIGGSINFLGFLPTGEFSDAELQLIIDEHGGILSDQPEVVVTPEPASGLLLSSFILLAGFRWMRRKSLATGR
jgi:hypothetical protein